MRAAFYCVADERYFLGAVGLVNSLRLVGHRERIFVLDCGLDDEQRELLAPEVELVAAPPGAPPWLRKTVAPLRRPADVAVLVDADMIVTRSLSELIERAARRSGDRVPRPPAALLSAIGASCSDLGTAAPAPYVSSGLVFCGGPTGRRVLELLDERQRAGRLRAHLLAPQRPRLPVPLRRPGRPQRDPRHRATAPTGPSHSTSGSRRHRRTAACGSPTRARCAAPIATAPSPTSCTSSCASRGSRPPTTASTRGCCGGCSIADDVAVRPPRGADPAADADRRAALALSAPASTRADFLRWHLGDRLPRPIATRVEDLRRPRETPSP